MVRNLDPRLALKKKLEHRANTIYARVVRFRVLDKYSHGLEPQRVTAYALILHPLLQGLLTVSRKFEPRWARPARAATPVMRYLVECLHGLTMDLLGQWSGDVECLMHGSP